MEKNKIPILIVDDEPLARRRIRRLLGRHSDVEVIGECADGAEAVAAIQKHRPALVFLDVQMPGIDGFAALAEVTAVTADAMPLIIFVTAHDQYALRAFEVNALDYLLKPFDRSRFEGTLERARARLTARGDINQRAIALLEEMRARQNHLDRLVIKSGGRAFFLKTEEIDWVEAEGKYVRLHVGRESHLVREGISNLETQLDPRRFARIHRSTIVNIDRVRELQPWFHNDYRVILRDGTALTMSRGCRKRLGELLGGAL